MKADNELFKFSLPEVWKIMNSIHSDEQARRRARLQEQTAALLKYLVNEKIALEDMLTEIGRKEMSDGLLAIEWFSMWTKMKEEKWARQERGYWKNLRDALLGRK